MRLHPLQLLSLPLKSLNMQLQLILTPNMMPDVIFKFPYDFFVFTRRLISERVTNARLGLILNVGGALLRDLERAVHRAVFLLPFQLGLQMHFLIFQLFELP